MDKKQATTFSYEHSYRLTMLWYIARLRANALARSAEQELTPITRINSDRQILEQMVAETVDQQPPPVRRRNVQGLGLVWLAGSLVAALLIIAGRNFYSWQA